ncbi:MAG: hypothetical protein WC959_01415 [Kiritimatiellales bacterium]
MTLQPALDALAAMKPAVPAVRPIQRKVMARSSTQIDSLRAALNMLDSSVYDTWFDLGLLLNAGGWKIT